MNPIDFDECLTDSPGFRNKIRQATGQIDLVEDRLEQIVRLCNVLVASGKQFFQDFQKLLKNLLDIRDLFPSDEILRKIFSQFEHFFLEIENFFENVFEQTNQTILRTLNRILKEKIKKVKDQGKLFDRLSSDLDVALQRHVDAPKSKTIFCDDAEKIYLATRSCFSHASIDYSQQINILFDQQRVELVELFLSFVNFYKNFFHQGYESLVIDGERQFGAISLQINQIRQENFLKQNQFERFQQIDQQNEPKICQISSTKSSLQLKSNASSPVELVKEGYLFKRSHHKFGPWSRRWFFIRHGQILYTKRNQNEISQENCAPSVLVSDLRLCTIRMSNEFDRRYVFEIISPNSSHFLQSDSQSDCDQWISALQLKIANLFKSNDDPKNKENFSKNSVDDRPSASSADSRSEFREKLIKEKIDFVRSIPGNEKCADCEAEAPEWASINLGILVCLNCGGSHRGLGVNLSKVRSLHMDSWELETLLVMSELGNTIVNSFYEGKITNEFRKPNAETDAISRRNFIEAKYVRKAFLSPLTILNPVRPAPRSIKRWTVLRTASNGGHSIGDVETDRSSSFRANLRNFRRIATNEQNEFNDETNVENWSPNLYLYESARQRQVPMMLHALALGADRNFQNENDSGRTPLIQTIRSRSVAAAEFLLSNNSNVNLADETGRTALHYGTQLANKGRGSKIFKQKIFSRFTTKIFLFRPIILLLKRGADPLVKDSQGVDCFALAMKIADPDVVTWFRLIALREQMKNEDDDDEKTFQTIIDDPVYLKEIARTPSFS